MKKIEKTLKNILKRKVKINLSTIICFLLMGALYSETLALAYEPPMFYNADNTKLSENPTDEEIAEAELEPEKYEVISKRNGEVLSIVSDNFRYNKETKEIDENGKEYSNRNIATVVKDGKIVIGMSDKPTFKEISLESSNDGTSIGSITYDKDKGILINGRELAVSNNMTDTLHYLSIKQSTETGNYKNDGAKSEGSVAIGANVRVEDSINSTAIGYNNSIEKYVDSGGSSFSGEGYSYTFGGENSIRNSSNTTNIGVKNIIEHSQNSFILGNENISKNENRLGLNNSQLMGNQNTISNTKNSIIIGNINKEQDSDSIYIIGTGNSTNKTNYTNILGSKNNIASAGNSSIIGESNANNSRISHIFGNENNIGSSLTSMTLGNQNTLKSVIDSIALGNQNSISRNNSFAIGNRNNIVSSNTYVLGSDITVDVNNSVFLGDKSTMTSSNYTNVPIENKTYDSNGSIIKGITTTGGSNGTITKGRINKGTNKEIVYGGEVGKAGIFAGATSIGGVSVGYSGGERRIMNVAAGELSSTSTDAVNGSQLYAVALKNYTPYFSVNSTEDGNYKNDGAKGVNSIAIGPNSKATGNKSMAIGLNAQSGGENSVALGSDAQALVSGSFALLKGAVAKDTFDNKSNAMALGIDALANGWNALAFGSEAVAEQKNAVAIGSLSNATKNNIALGAYSKAENVNITGDFNFKIDGITDAKTITAPTDKTAVFSIGNPGQPKNHSVDESVLIKTRQIQNVAVGVVSETSTDAINGSQLWATANNLKNYSDQIGWSIGDNSNKVDINNRLNGASDRKIVKFVSDSTDVLSVTLDTTNVNEPTIKIATKTASLRKDNNEEYVVDNVDSGNNNYLITAGDIATNLNELKNLGLDFTADINGVNSNDKIHRNLGESLAIKSANFLNNNKEYKEKNLKTRINTVDNSIEIGFSDSPEFSEVIAPVFKTSNRENTPSMSSTGINAGKQKITNVATGTEDTDAVNVKQLRDSINAVNTNVAVSKTEVTSEDNSVKVTSKTADDGHTIYNLAVEKSNLTVSEDGKTVSSETSGNAFVTGDDVSTVVNKAIASARTEVENGKNTTVSKETGSNGQDVYKVNVDGDLADITSIKNGETQISLDKEKKEVNVSNAKITNVADGEVSETSKEAVNGSQLHKEVAKIKNDVARANEEIAGKVESNTQAINELRNDHNNGMAQMAAMSAVDFGHTKTHKVKVGAGLGGYKGARAVAVGVAFSPTENLLINGKWATPANTVKGSVFGVGATYEFDWD